MRELLNCRFVEERRNVLCLGKPGLGKTRVAKAIAHAACTAGYSCLCVLTAEMLEDLHASQADRSFRRALRRYVKPQLLLLDEFACEPFGLKACNEDPSTPGDGWCACQGTLWTGSELSVSGVYVSGFRVAAGSSGMSLPRSASTTAVRSASMRQRRVASSARAPCARFCS